MIQEELITQALLTVKVEKKAHRRITVRQKHVQI